MVNEIDILHERHSSDFTCHAGKKAAGLFCVVSYHHEIIVELGEYGFYSLAESLVCPHWRTPVFLIQPIRDFKSNIGYLKEIFLHLGTKIVLVTKHHAVVILPAYILEIMEVMNACRRHVIFSNRQILRVSQDNVLVYKFSCVCMRTEYHSTNNKFSSIFLRLRIDGITLSL